MLGEQSNFQNCHLFHQQEQDQHEDPANEHELLEVSLPLASTEIILKEKVKEVVETNELAREEASETFYKIETQFKKIAARIYAKRIKDIELEQRSIAKRSHMELNSRWKEMEKMHSQKLKDLEALSKFQTERIGRYKSIAIEQIRANFEVLKRHRKIDMIKDLYAEMVKLRCRGKIVHEKYVSNALDIKLRRKREREERLRTSRGRMTFSSVDGLNDEDIQQDILSMGLCHHSLNSVSFPTEPLPSPPSLSPIANHLSFCNHDSAYGSYSDASNNPEKQSVETSPIPNLLPLQPPEILAPDSCSISKTIQVRDGKIYVDQFCFSKGDVAYLFENGLISSVKLIQIGEEILFLVLPDGSKTSLNVDRLLDGRVTLAPKNI